MDQVSVHAKIEIIQQITLAIAGLRPDACTTRFEVLRLNLWDESLQRPDECLLADGAVIFSQSRAPVPCGYFTEPWPSEGLPSVVQVEISLMISLTPKGKNRIGSTLYPPPIMRVKCTPRKGKAGSGTG